MNLVIDDATSAFEQLSKPSIALNEGDIWINGVSSVDQLDDNKKFSLTSSFAGSKTFLPWPFDRASVHYRRSGSNYLVNVVVVSHEGTHFNGFSKVLEREKPTWRSVKQNGVGYFVDNDGEAMISVAKPVVFGNINPRARLFSVGSFGARPRRFGSLEEFCSDVGALMGKTQEYVNLYTQWVAGLKGRQIPDEHRDLTVYLTSI